MFVIRGFHYIRFFCIIIMILALTGCAVATKENPDPYMGYNRGMYRFNNDFNKMFLTPLTIAYSDVTPGFVRTGVSNFFSNINTVSDVANDVLQGNWRYFLKDTARLFLNTTLGLFGLIDVASNAGLPPHQQSFGLTLYKWGIMRHSPYFVLPFLGPSTVRGTIGLVPDYFMNPISYYRPRYARYILKGVEFLQKATSTLPKLNFIIKNAIDPYVALRNVYLQNQKLVVKQIMTDGQFQGETSPIVPVTFTEPTVPQPYLSKEQKIQYREQERTRQEIQKTSGVGVESPILREKQQQQLQKEKKPTHDNSDVSVKPPVLHETHSQQLQKKKQLTQDISSARVESPVLGSSKQQAH